MLYHVIVITLSAGIALSLPFAAGVFAENFAAYWAIVANEKIVLISMEIAVALLLILTVNYIGRSITDRKLSEMAAEAGLVNFFSTRGRLTQRRIRRLKARQGIARNVMTIGSTGFRTFVDPRGDMHHVLENCLEAKILLLDPYSEGATARTRAIPHPDVTTESLKEQVRKSIEFLKRLRAAQKNIKLKLYPDPPHLKLAILGDYIWMQHYHTSLDVQTMPELVFKHNQNDHGLYTVFYQYFVRKWESPDIPEYDLETDEIIFRGNTGSEVRREPFDRDTKGQDCLETV